MKLPSFPPVFYIAMPSSVSSDLLSSVVHDLALEILSEEQILVIIGSTIVRFHPKFCFSS